MFEKISGFFKQFTRRRKRQSGETTIMEAGREPSADDFGLDDEFGGMDSFGDTDDSSGDLQTEEPGGFMEAEAETEPRVEEAFSDFDFATDESNITTGGTDLDERTVSDEISGSSGGVGDSAGALDGAFELGEEAAPFDDALAEPKAVSPLKAVLTVVIAAVVAIGIGVAIQLFAWPSVSQFVGLGSDEVKLDPEVELNSAKRQKVKLTQELAEFKKVGGPGEVQALKRQITETRDTQGTMEEFGGRHEGANKKEAAYDRLMQRITQLETDLSATSGEIRKVRAEIDQTRQDVVKLAAQSKEEYERFRFELVRAELGRRVLIELKMQDIESFQAEVAKLVKRLSKLSAMTSEPAVETSETE